MKPLIEIITILPSITQDQQNPSAPSIITHSERNRNAPIMESLEAFPKLQFWKSNLEIRGFARLKA
jgi:hypothetical protein